MKNVKKKKNSITVSNSPLIRKTNSCGPWLKPLTIPKHSPSQSPFSEGREGEAWEMFSKMMFLSPPLYMYPMTLLLNSLFHFHALSFEMQHISR
jgi:hypothetical protein